MTSQLYDAHTNEEHTQALANLLPGGRVFGSKNLPNSNLRDLIRVFAPEMARFESQFLELSKEHNINNADVYLPLWEEAMGIPDNCFPGTGTIEERRQHVILKLACMNGSTEADYIEIAEKLGLTVEIEKAKLDNQFPYTFPFAMFANIKEYRFTLIIRIISGENLNVFPYTFPFTFGDPATNVLKCIYNFIKPAVCNVVFLEG